MDTPAAPILVIDDDAAVRALAQHTLKDEGRRVALAAEAHGGLTWAEDAAPGAPCCVSLPHAH